MIKYYCGLVLRLGKHIVMDYYDSVSFSKGILQLLLDNVYSSVTVCQGAFERI